MDEGEEFLAEWGGGGVIGVLGHCCWMDEWMDE